MAKIRKFCAYRRLERAYTRKSKYKRHNFIRATPNHKIVKFDSGNTKREFEVFVDLSTKEPLQIRHNALESARVSSQRYLEKMLGKNGFHLKVRVYPHHILRENPLASGAGADRMSTGMKMSFGKPIGLAARLRKGQAILSVGVEKDKVAVAKEALRRSIYKLPCSCRIAKRGE